MFQFYKYPQTDLNQQNLDWMIQTIKDLQKKIGAGGVQVVSTYAEMSNVNVIYVYVGSEPGMNTDHWYYYDTATSSWVDGGSWGGASVTLPLAITDGGTGATTVAGARNALGLGNTSGALPIANGGTGSHTAVDAYTALGGGAAGKLDTVDIAHGGTGAATVEDARNALGLGHTAGALPIANGGTGSATAAAARTALGITPASIGAVPTTDLPLSIANGGTGAATASAARTALGLGVVSGTLTSSTATLSEIVVMQIGNVVEVKGYATFSNAVAQNDTVTIGTVTGVSNPPSIIRGLAGSAPVHAYDATNCAYYSLGPNGELTVKPPLVNQRTFTFNIVYLVP